MQSIFQTILFQPIFNLFVLGYNFIPDVGVVIILLTFIIKLALYPSTAASIKAQKSLTDLQPKINAIKKQHEGNQQLIATETMKIYQEHKVNPLGSCLPLLIQLPILIALYWVLQAGLTNEPLSGSGVAPLSLLYSFVPNPGHINTISLGLFDLSKTGNVVLALLAGVAQFWQFRMMTNNRPPKDAGAGAKDEDMAAVMNKQMMFLMPAMTIFIGIKFPAGLALYWLVSTVLTGLQQILIFKKPTEVEVIPSAPKN